MVNPFRRGVVSGDVAKAQRDPPDEPMNLLSDRKQLALVRQGRWKRLLEDFPPARRGILLWVEQMNDVQGPRVQVWENTVDWLTALYIVRYGENEAFWPEQLSAADVDRARQWQLGDIPQGVKGVDK